MAGRPFFVIPLTLWKSGRTSALSTLTRKTRHILHDRLETQRMQFYNLLTVPYNLKRSSRRETTLACSSKMPQRRCRSSVDSAEAHGPGHLGPGVSPICPRDLYSKSRYPEFQKYYEHFEFFFIFFLKFWNFMCFKKIMEISKSGGKIVKFSKIIWNNWNLGAEFQNFQKNYEQFWNLGATF